MTNRDFLKKLGTEVKVARIRGGLKRRDVSNLTGLCINAIGNIENGKKDAHILSYKRIADCLNIDMKNFL